MTDIEFNETIKTIEANTVFKLSAATDKGAFMIPVQNNIPMGTPFHMTFKELKALSGIKHP